MSAAVAIDQPAPHQIQLLLRQDSAEVTRFMLFVLIIALAFFLLMPQACSSPVPLLGLVGAAVGWCAIAGSAREVYLFDRAARTVRVQRISLLMRFEEFLSVQEVVAVQQAVRGPDDNRLVLELVTELGELRLRLPHRINTLGAADQDSVGRLIAGHLGIRLRPAPNQSV